MTMDDNRRLNDAVHRWVEGWNAIPLALIEKAYRDYDEMPDQLTGLQWTCDNCGWDYEDAHERAELERDDDNELLCAHCKGSSRYVREHAGNTYGGAWPAWGTMFTFENSLDEDWARHNLEIMDQCGLVVYESEELGLFFGVDGGGFSFVDEIFTPLYKARGLQWHLHEEG